MSKKDQGSGEGDKDTIVTIIVRSSIPKTPPQHLSLATIRRIKAIRAIIPPASPAADTTFVRSLTGAPHNDVVTFFVAIEILESDCQWSCFGLTQRLSDCAAGQYTFFEGDSIVGIKTKTLLIRGRAG